MKDIIVKTEDKKILVSLSKEYYERTAVFAAAHKLTDRFAVLVEPLDDHTVGVYFQPKMGIELSEKDLKEAALDFCNEVLDQQVRLDIEARYGSIRDMIIKQAFSPISLSELSNIVEKNNVIQ